MTAIMMVRRDQVLALLRDHHSLREAVSKLPAFPAPNPEERDNKNIMGQTEDDFWAMVDEI